MENEQLYKTAHVRKDLKAAPFGFAKGQKVRITFYRHAFNIVTNKIECLFIARPTNEACHHSSILYENALESFSQ